MSLHAPSSQACHLLKVRTIMFWTLRFCIPLLRSCDFGVRPCLHTATSFLDLRCDSRALWNIFWNICTRFSFSLLGHTGLLWHSSLPSATLHTCPPAAGYALLSWVLGSQPDYFFMVPWVPIPGCFFFLHVHSARVSSTTSNEFKANLSLNRKNAKECVESTISQIIVVRREVVSVRK